MKNSSIFPDWAWRRVSSFSVALVCVAVLAAAGKASALDPNRRASQYMHDRWGGNNGFPAGRVNSITQTADGYLWIATSHALVRFDGFSFQTLEQLDPSHRTVSAIQALLTDSDGNLWLEDESRRLLQYRDHTLIDVLSNSGYPDARIVALSRTQDGGMLMTTSRLDTFRYRNGKVAMVEPLSAPVPGVVPRSIAETSDGKIWIGSYEEGLSYKPRGQNASAKTRVLDSKINTLLPVDNGGLWIGTDNGLFFWDGSKISPQNPTESLSHAQILALAKDRSSNIWVGTSDGLFRLTSGNPLSAETVPDEAGRVITAIFEDREGNLWIGDSFGLVRMRDGAFSTFSKAEGFPPDSNGPLYVDGENRIWIAGSDGGLYQVANGRVERVPVQHIRGDTVYSIAGDRDEIWLGQRQSGLTHLTPSGKGFVATSYTHSQGLAQDSVSAVLVSRDGAIWAGTFSGGVSRLRQGKFQTFTTADGLGSNTITSIGQGANGTLWFGTSNGLSQDANGHWRTLTERDGLPSNEVSTIRMDSSGVLWIGTTHGLAYLTAEHIHVAAESEPLLHEAIFGIAEGPNGDLWMSTLNHVFKVKRSALISGALNAGDLHTFGPVDGLPGTDGVRGERTVVTDHTGRVWFSISRGLAVVYPSRADRNQAPAIPHIEGLLVDGNRRPLEDAMRIPPFPQQVSIRFVGLSLAVPDRVRYRYKLDGYDHDWSSPIESRQVDYTKLGPGTYRFHLKTANSDGLWNDSEITFPFRIEPALWQALWFQLLCCLILILASWLFYLRRMQLMTRRLNLRFEERLAERTRIAQDLHDTLLQGFISSSMLVHVATNEIPENSNARSLLQRSLELMGQVTQEGRKTLNGLRSSLPEDFDLREALISIPEVCGLHQGVQFQVMSDGLSQPMYPAVRDEVYRIAREAVVNAFRHSQATSIEVRVKYTWRQFQLSVGDNGIGIDELVVSQGKEGHWGLKGMRERAQGIGGKLTFITKPRSGTIVQLTVPGRVALRPKSGRTLLWLMLGLDPSRREAEKNGSEMK